MGITNPKIRETLNGGIIIEVPGENGVERADNLAAQLRSATEGIERCRGQQQGRRLLLSDWTVQYESRTPFRNYQGSGVVGSEI